MNWIWISCGGALGSMLRYKISLRLAPLTSRFPWATWFINVSGSFLLGLGIGWGTELPIAWTLFYTVGFCGAYTTFSTLSVEAMELIRSRRVGAALAYIISTSIICMLSAALGLYIGS